MQQDPFPSCDEGRMHQATVNRRTLLQAGSLGVVGAVIGGGVVEAADPRARCTAPEFVKPEEVLNLQKWNWPLPQPKVADHVDPGPGAVERQRWDGKYGMHQIQPKGWINVEDIRKGNVEHLWDKDLKNVIYTFDAKDKNNPPIIRPSPEEMEAETVVGGTRERLKLKIAPEFWQIEGGFNPEHFWAMHKAIPFYEVVLGSFEAEVVPGFRTPVWGYNRQVPGPTFVEEVNRPLVVRFINELPAEASIHLHGGHTPSHSDGHPAFLTCPDGGYRDYFYSNGVPKIPTVDPLKEPAKWDWSESSSTMWYHDHANDITAHNALMGLAGFFLVTDAWERFLVKHHILPKPDYVDPKNSRDIPIVLGDRCICKPQPNSDLARIHFDPFDHNGYLGNIPVCNGRAFSRLDVKAHKYRFRFLNGALARVHLLELWDAGDCSDKQGPELDSIFASSESLGTPVVDAWDRIAKDSWMLDKPVKDTSILLGMANRADVVVDFKKLLKGRKKGTFFLVNVCDQRNGRGPGHGDNESAEQDAEGTQQNCSKTEEHQQKVLKTALPRGTREDVPRLDDRMRLQQFSENDGGPNWGTLKLIRIEVVDDGSKDPCEYDFELSRLKTLLAEPKVKAEIAKLPELSEQAGVHLRRHDDLMTELTWDQIKSLPTRRFDFERGRGAWRISHRFFDELRTDAPMVLGGLELWHLVNRSGGWWHPIHIHLESHQQVVVDFKGMSRSRLDAHGKPFSSKYKCDLQPHDKCKHDTALLGPNTEIWLLMRFRTFKGPFVFHCHNLNHEDMRMMTNFDPRLESLGPDTINPDQELFPIITMTEPKIPDEVMKAQMAGKFLPVPAPVPVQQFFGEDC